MPPVHWGTVEILEFPPYTEDEAPAVWYDDDELEAISCDMFRTAAILSREPNQHHLDVGDDCTRGLEDMTVHGSITRIMAKLRMDTAVLEEQRRQRESGIRDEEAIAKASQVESEKHTHKAAALGQKDQKCADEILHRYRESLDVQTTPKGKQSWFRRHRTGKRESGKHPRLKVGVAIRRLVGFKR